MKNLKLQLSGYLYRFESLDETIAERDRINAKLAPGYVLEFVGCDRR
jgi:hypothetical protein